MRWDIVILGLQIDAGLLVEDVADVTCEGVVDGRAVGQSVDVQVDGGAHHLGKLDLAGQFLLQGDMLGTDAQNDILRLDVVLGQLSLLVLGTLFTVPHAFRMPHITRGWSFVIG